MKNVLKITRMFYEDFGEIVKEMRRTKSKEEDIERTQEKYAEAHIMMCLKISNMPDSKKVEILKSCIDKISGPNEERPDIEIRLE